jgi:hypothetical protein
MAYKQATWALPVHVTAASDAAVAAGTMQRQRMRCQYSLSSRASAWVWALHG